MSARTQRDVALLVWERALYQPYRWGGDDPVWGFDCSGMVIEGLKAAGIFDRDKDDTAAGLAQRYKMIEPPYQAGTLLFWGAPAITHVEAVWDVINGHPFTIGASGGGSATRTAEAAARFNAYVKIRPARRGWVRAVDPFV